MMADNIIEFNGTVLERLSDWLDIKTDCDIPTTHPLWDYATDDYGRHPYEKEFDGSGTTYLDYFNFEDKEFAINQFLLRHSLVCGFDLECKRYPSYIMGYNAEELYNPLLIEFDEYDKCRLYRELTGFDRWVVTH